MIPTSFGMSGVRKWLGFGDAKRSGGNHYFLNLTAHKTMPELSIIIVNWNSLKWLPECLGSIFATTSSSDVEVIVVDNASTEDKTVKIRELFPQVKAIRSNKNLGFAGANNLGVRKSRGEYLLFLNPDTKALGSAIDTMLKCLRSTPNVGAVG